MLRIWWTQNKKKKIIIYIMDIDKNIEMRLNELEQRIITLENKGVPKVATPQYNLNDDPMFDVRKHEKYGYSYGGRKSRKRNKKN
jgi:hypothetical protein